MKKFAFVLLTILSTALIVLIAAMVIKIFGPEIRRNVPETAAEQENEAGDTETAAYEVSAETEISTEEIQATDEETEAAVAGEIKGSTISFDTEPEEETEEEDNSALLDLSIDFSFDKMSNEIWNGSVSLTDGTEKELVLPVMSDPDSGDKILADGYRKIVCAEENGDSLIPCVIDESSLDEEALLDYESFIEIRDLFASAGWDDPDNETELPETVTEALDNVSVSAHRLLFVGDTEDYHLFTFSANANENADYEELYKKVSEVFSEMDSAEYVLVIK